MANFKKVNLLESFSNIGYFDIIFCRNVAIYFKQHDKVKLFKKLASILEPDGALIVGGSESLTGVAPDFKVNHYLKGIYYTLNDNSVEKSKDVKKFAVHTFASKPVQEKPKVVKRIKRTIRYVNPGGINKQPIIKKTKLQQTQETLEELKRKRMAMNKKSEDFKKEKSEERVESKAYDEVVQTPIPAPLIQKRSLHQVLNNKQTNQSSLLGSISNKYVNTNTLEIKRQNVSSGNSLLSRITNK